MLIEQGWSRLACAILKQYHKDLKSKKTELMNDDWYDDLLALATRFAKIKITRFKNEKGKSRNEK